MIHEDEELETVTCPACGREQWEGEALLGTLGNRTHFRCRGCGAEWSQAEG